MVEPICESVHFLSFFFGDVPSGAPFWVGWALLIPSFWWSTSSRSLLKSGLTDVNVLIPYILLVYPHACKFLGQKSFVPQNLEVIVSWLLVFLLRS